MSSDGSAGRRDGFERWVASMKRAQQPLQGKPAASKPMDKLELELDENATHVHRIPKDLINRMREQRATEQREARQRSAPEPAKPAPPPEPVKPVAAPEPAKPLAAPEHSPASLRGQLAQAFAADAYDDDDEDSSLGGVSDDRTAVFRPPPELLARAKRMKPPSKPNPSSELPTKPPPASAAGDGGESSYGVPAASRLPAFESVPVKASYSSSVPAAANYASSSSLDERVAPRVSAPEVAAVDLAQLSGVADSQPISSQEVERSAVFAHSEATSGVLSLGLPDTSGADELLAAAPLAADAGEAAVVPIANDALLNALTASAAEPSTDASDEEPPAPTTTSPLVRSERSVAPEAARTGAPRLSLWLAVVLAAAAFVVWRLRHGF